MAKIPVIKAVNLSKEFELGSVTVQALAGVNLEIYSGEFIIFFGPSGCGKSTLMSMVAGLQPPSSGQIAIRGEDLSKLNENQLADHRRQKIGMVFQSFNLIGSMNVVENIALPLAFARIGKKRRLARAENLLEVVGMSEYKKHTPAELSGGQQQKIAIARALVANPWIMLADEPTGNLDSKSANEVMRLLISLNRKSKRTVVLITHNPDYLEYADRVFYLKDGKVADVKVNAKVKKIEEVSSVGKLKDTIAPETSEEDTVKNEAAKEDAAIEMVAAVENASKTVVEGNPSTDSAHSTIAQGGEQSRTTGSTQANTSIDNAQDRQYDAKASEVTRKTGKKGKKKKKVKDESKDDDNSGPASSLSQGGPASTDASLDESKRASQGGLGPISLGS